MSEKNSLPSATRQQILQAALAVFLEVGFDRASLDRVAAEAGVTKPTVYSHFGSKIGLLQAVAMWQSEQALNEFKPMLSASGNVRQDLTDFAKTFLKNIVDPNFIRLHRFAMVEAITHPELVGPLLDAGPRQLHQALAGYLESQTKAGKLRCSHARLAAEQLTGLLIGMDFIHVVVSLDLPSDRELQKRIKAAIDLFLNSYLVQER